MGNTDIILNISTFLIEPSILIIDHYYINNQIKIVIDKNFSIKQVENFKRYLESLITSKYILQMFNTNNLFLKIIYEINTMNNYWLKTGHSIYFSKRYIINQWKKTYLYKIDNRSLQTYSYNFYKAMQIDKYNFIASHSNKLNIFSIINKVQSNILKFENKIKISEIRFIMKYWGLYFSDYLLIINNDLSRFRVSDLISFINIEENIFQSLINV